MITTDIKKRLSTTLLLLLVTFLIIKFNIFLLYVLIVFGVFSILEFFNISAKISKNNLLKTLNNLLFTIFIFCFCLLFFFFSNIPQLKIITFILLFGCIASDIGGLVIGKIFKGPKLTKLSPKKTISGAVGSLLFTIIIINIIFYKLFGIFGLETLTISIFTSIGCQMGDLFFSFLKRKAKIKDTGNILPGHGGILDRVDGILLGIPSGFITLTLFH